MILPDEGVSTDDLLARGDIFTLTQENADSWADQKYLIVNLALPKFDVSSDLDLRAGLAELGLGELFDAETADFSPVTDNAEGLYLSGATHAARVKIDEEGCEAAGLHDHGSGSDRDVAPRIRWTLSSTAPSSLLSPRPLAPRCSPALLKPWNNHWGEPDQAPQFVENAPVAFS